MSPVFYGLSELDHLGPPAFRDRCIGNADSVVAARVEQAAYPQNLDTEVVLRTGGSSARAD